jgi:uracil-DNA glycosylase family 4
MGKLLKKYILKPLGLAPSDITIVSAIKCRPPTQNVLKLNRDMCAPFLARDLSGAEKIITLGADALNAVNSEHKVKASGGLIVRTGGDVPVMISYSPAQALTTQKNADGEQNNKWGTIEMIKAHIKQLLSEETRVLPAMEIINEIPNTSGGHHSRVTPRSGNSRHGNRYSRP